MNSLLRRHCRRAIAALIVSAAMLGGVGASSASAYRVSVTFNGNPCYIWGQSLSKWKAVVTGPTTTTLNAGSNRTIWTDLRSGSHNFVIQSWCNGISIARGASGNRWIYNSGETYTNFWAGIFY
jgi:hypothetical protein